MSSLTSCLKIAGKAISKEDVALIKDLRKNYIDDGLSNQKAVLAAVADVIELAESDYAEIVKQIEAQGGEVPVRIEPVKKKEPTGGVTRQQFRDALTAKGFAATADNVTYKITESAATPGGFVFVRIEDGIRMTKGDPMAGWTMPLAVTKAVEDAYGIEQKPATKKKHVAKVKESAETEQARADLDAALGDLGDILMDKGTLKAMPIDEGKLLPVLARVIDAGIRLGYHKFKDVAKFTMATIREKMGDAAADAITLDHLQGVYIGISHKYQGADSKRKVIGYESLDELLETKPEAGPLKVGQTITILADDMDEQGQTAVIDSIEGDDITLDNGSVYAPADLEAVPEKKGAKPAKIGIGGKGNERDRQDGEASPGTLGGVAAEHDQGAEGSGDLFAGSEEGGRPSAAGDTGAATERVPESVSGGSDTTAIHPAGAGGRGGKGGRAGGRKRGNGKGVSGRPAATGIENKPNIPAVNFVITDKLGLGKGSESVKFSDNIAAIKVLKTLAAERRRATPEEQATLARYVGWGGMKNAFAVGGQFKAGWEDRGAELAGLLNAKDLASARASVRAAHYTSETIVRAMWTAVKQFGHQGGLALEQSAGTGNFLGMAPEDMRNRFVAVEFDSITAQIAHALYPQSTVLHSGMQKVPLPDRAFDLVIGNPPFGKESLNFRTKPELRGKSIHNQFFIAGLDALKPGGIMGMVVSRYLMDAKDKSSRIELAKRGRLLGGIRLPDTAFKENARTEVVTDILFFQRHDDTTAEDTEKAFQEQGRPPRNESNEEHTARIAREALIPAWIETGNMADPLGGDAMVVNNYFANNPDMIAGTLERSGSMRFDNDMTVRLDKTEDLGQRLADLVAKLPRNVVSQTVEEIQAAVDRHKGLSDALEIALSGGEEGAVRRSTDGELKHIYDKETPEGGTELASRVLTVDSPWSSALDMDEKGRWFREVKKLDEKGKPIKDGRFNVYTREVFNTEADVPRTMRLGQATLAKLNLMVDMRDLLVNQLTIETDNAPVKEIEANRLKLRRAYRAFVKEHGPVNANRNMRVISRMPDEALILSLEIAYRQEQKVWTGKTRGKAKIYRIIRKESADMMPILTERVKFPYEAPDKAANSSDALAISLAETGRVDLDRIAGLLGKTIDEVTDDLYENMDEPLIYQNPEDHQWEMRDTYLTGQIKRKLQTAIAAGLTKHITALEKVVPPDVGAENITPNIGMTWVSRAVYGQFLTHLTGADARVLHSSLTNAYDVQGHTESTKAEEWGSDGVDVVKLYSDILNSKQTRVYSGYGKERAFNQEWTDLALLKRQQIELEFTDWIFNDSERRRQMVNDFNLKHNTRVRRQYNGDHMIFPGKVPGIEFMRHQKNAIWRGVFERFMLLDHAVGSGKTFTSIARVMERRRMGLSKKPMIVVPNHMVTQFGADVYRLYPGAKVLVLGKKDLGKKRRRRVFAKIATGDWDVVIMPHSSFKFIKISPDTEERYLLQALDEAEAAIVEAQAQADEDAEAGGGSSWGTPFNVSQAESVRTGIENQLDKLRDQPHDNLITFEQMGVDDLTIDEAHEFKNLQYNSRLTGVRGLGNKAGSKKAFDLYSKVRTLHESPTGTVTFMTGTPISNSAVEMYNLMRYLSPDELDETGLGHFDAWRSQYVGVATKWEPTEQGTLKEVNRLGRSWSNMQSLMEMYYSFADAVSNDNIKENYREDNGGEEFPIPPIKGGHRQAVKMMPTRPQEEMLAQVLSDFEGLPSMSDRKERNAERLRLMDRARKLSLDIRAVNAFSQSKEKGGKLDVVAGKVAEIAKKWDKDKGTQLIFLDRSVPRSNSDLKRIRAYDAVIRRRDQAIARDDEAAYQRAVNDLEQYDSVEIEELRIAQVGGWNAYQQLKDNLVALGMKEGEIRFVQEANTDLQKQTLFDTVNTGETRVLIGSTPRMGSGTNFQQRLVALHHVDVTWKPSDIEQREGRIIRQGNLLLDKYPDFEVEINAYVTERTMDAKMWDLNADKQRMITGIRQYDGSFNMEFDDTDAISMAEIAAIATGDPLMLERITLGGEIDKLHLMERAHQRQMWGRTDAIERLEGMIRNYPGEIEQGRKQRAKLEAVIKTAEEQSAGRSVTIEGKKSTTEFDAMMSLELEIKRQREASGKQRYSISVNGKRFTAKAEIEREIKSSLGDEGFVATADGKTYTTRMELSRHIATIAAEKTQELLDNGSIESQKIGTLYGLSLELDASENAYKKDVTYTYALSLITDSGKTFISNDMNAQDNPDPSAVKFSVQLKQMAARIEGMASDRTAEWQERELARAKKELPDLLAKKDTGFAQADELVEKQKRLEEIITQLAGSNNDLPTYTGQANAMLGQGKISIDTGEFTGSGTDRWYLGTPGLGYYSNAPKEGWATEAEAREWMAAHTTGSTDIQYSRIESEGQPGITRRQFNTGLAIATVMASSPFTASLLKSNSVVLGKAQAISEDVFDQPLSSVAQGFLRGPAGSKTQIDGAKRISNALQEVATKGPKETRALASKILKLMPKDGVLLTIDDTSIENAHGAVSLDPIPHMTLFTAGKSNGLTITTFLHESLHIAIAARYRSLGVGVVRSNDKIIGIKEPSAAKALKQLKQVWDEYELVADKENGEVGVTEAYRSLDEFFIRALTDPNLQEYLAGIEYRGSTLWERFKDWIKYALLGFRKSGVAASWLDAALTASDDLLVEMAGDNADFKRLRETNKIQNSRRRANNLHTLGAGITGTAAFKQWFGDSKVVDANGEPLVVYHGTNKDVSEFSAEKSMEDGLTFFTDSQPVASDFSLYRRTYPGAQVIPAYLNISNPLVIEGEKQEIRKVEARAEKLFSDIKYGETIREYARRKGYDGIIFNEVLDNIPSSPNYPRESTVYAVFKSTQIKSAIGNRGTFDANDPNILYSKTTIPGLKDEHVEHTRKANAAVKTWVRRNFTKEGLMPDSAYRAKLQKESLQNVGEEDVAAMVYDLEKAMTKAFGAKRYNEIGAADLAIVNAYLAGENVKLPDGLADTIDAMRGYLDRLSSDMLKTMKEMMQIEYGKLSEKQRDQFSNFLLTGEGEVPAGIAKHFFLYQKISENMGVYLNRSYQAFDDKHWKEKAIANKGLIQRAEAFIAEENPDLDPEEVTGAVLGILQNAKDSGNFAGMVMKGTMIGSKDVSFLRRKKNVPLVIRQLLGEYKDPKTNFVKSATKMQWYIANHNFLMSIRKSGLGVFLFERRTGQFHVEIATPGSEVLNPINGLFTTEEFRQGLEDANEKYTGSEFMRNLIRLNSMVKYNKTILSPTTQFRNFYSASMFTVMNGHFNWTHMGKSIRAAKADIFTHDKEWRAYLTKMIGLGVLHDNPYAGELRDALNDFTQMNVYTKGPAQGLKRFLNFMQKAYQVGDDFWKIIGFENELSLQLKYGKPLAEAEVIAAERIRNGYPTYSMVPRGIKHIRRWPLIGTFVSFPYEMVRTTYNQFGFLLEDAKAGHKEAVARRMIGMSVATGAAYAASMASMAMMGMDSDDDEAYKAQQPYWSRNSQLIYTGYNADGMPTHIDASYLDPYTYVKKLFSALLNGNNEGFTEKVVDSLTEFLDPFVGPDIAAGALFEVIANKRIGSGAPIYNPEDSGPRKAKDIMGHVRRAIQPGAFSNMERTMLALEGNRSRSGRQYSVHDEGLAWIGFRLGTLNLPESMIYKAYGFNDTIKNATRIVSREAGSAAQVSDRQLKSAVNAMLAARRRAYEKMFKQVQGARKLGMQDRDIVRSLRGAKISKGDIRAILQGRVPMWRMSKMFLKSSTDRAMVAATNDARRVELRQELQRRKQVIWNLIKEDHQ